MNTWDKIRRWFGASPNSGAPVKPASVPFDSPATNLPAADLNSLYQALWETTTDAIVVLDERNVIRFTNRAVEEIFGHPRHSLLGKNIAELQPVALREGHRQGSARYLSTRKRTMDWRHSEAVGLHRSGHEIPIEISFSHIETATGHLLVGFLRDIRERKEKERLQAQFAAIVASSVDAIVGMDLNGIVTSWNPAAQHIFGHTPQEMIGRPISVLAPPEYTEGQDATMARVRQGENIEHFESIRQRKNGDRFPVSVTISPIRDASGQVIGASKIARDISDRVRSEALHQQLEAQLRESQKMESIGTLAGGIAHDFNNILGAILGNVTLARDYIAASHAASPALDQIDHAGRRARDLVRQIIAFSRREPRQVSNHAISPILQDTYKLLRATLPAGVTMSCRLPDEPVAAPVDAPQIEQVLMNLCTNAWHALDGRPGTIELGVEPWTKDVPPTAGVSGGPWIHIWVADSGTGMDETTRARIFDPFFTTKPKGQGTGLGLAVAHGIVAAHGGTITVETAPGRGSTFHVFLPACPAAAPLAVESPPRTDGAAGSGERVLYVDDDETVLLMVERLLQRSGFSPLCVRNGEAALQAVASSTPKFNVVVTDMNMPGMSGLDLARALTQHAPGVPVILCTGGLFEDVLAASKLAGVRSVIEKQYLHERLPDTIRAAVAVAPQGSAP